MDDLKHIFSYVRPNSAYYVFPEINARYLEGKKDPSWDFALEILDKAQVAVVPGFAFGPNGEGHLRISFGRSEDDINKAFDRLDRHFKLKM